MALGDPDQNCLAVMRCNTSRAFSSLLVGQLVRDNPLDLQIREKLQALQRQTALNSPKLLSNKSEAVNQLWCSLCLPKDEYSCIISDIRRVR